MKKILFYLVLLLFSLNTTSLAQKQYIVKMATIAPEGSHWMDKMHEFEEEVYEATNQQVKFRTYPNGIQGDEVDVLRKMHLGQLDAGSFTGVGLGRIVSDIRVLDLPFLFENKAEVDYVYSALFPYFHERFLEKGYYLVSLAEVGFIYLFTKKKVTDIDDFKNIKMWLWKDDPLAKTVFDVMNIPAIPLDVTDVYTSLQTGLIDGVYISPYGCLALQWFTKTNYIMDYPLTHSVGGVLMTTRKLNSMPDDLRTILIDKTRENINEITQGSRKDNLEALQVLQQSGMEMMDISPEAEKDYQNAGKITRQKLVNDLYSQEILDRVLTLLAEFRSQQNKQENEE